ncbi:MAG TPA: hypothetical protein VF170_20620 [Planctomycetaceae bacterium]
MRTVHSGQPGGPGRAGRALPIAVAALLVAAAGIATWLWTRSPDRPTADEGRAVADAFLASIRDGDPDDAWQSTTAEFKSAEGRESFRRYVAKNPALKGPLEFVAVETVAVGDQPRDEFVYRPAGGAAAPLGKMVRVLVGNEFGEWKVDRVTVE